MFKGRFARKILIPVKKAFKICDKRLSSLIIGWRIRKIMKTKEIETLISQLKDYKRAMRDIATD